MPEIPDPSDVLLTKIRTKRREIAHYLDKAEPRRSRLLLTSIIAGALAAALTAGPGVGGEGFIASAKNLVSLGLPVWQILCLAATAFSVAAVISNGLLKSDNLTAKVADARSCDAKLEGLETMLELGQVELDRAAERYAECLADVAML